MRLRDEQIERYSRQIILRELGGTGQVALLAGRALVAGDGFAAAAALAYLAGAGVGSIRAIGGRSRDAGSAAFAAPSERSPDAALDSGDLRPDDALEAWDVAIVERGTADASAALPGRPRLGCAIVDTRGADHLALILLPAAGPPCPACAAARAAAGEPPPPILGVPPAGPTGGLWDAPDLGCAGALAALAACRWLAGLGPAEEVPRALVLAPDAPTWVERGVLAAPSCPRGCRPGG